MLTKEINDRLTQTGPGTPAGEFLRRYWQPVGLSSWLTPRGKPRQIRIMSEDLVLFRDEFGRPGLLGLHCSHRLTSLAYGRVEDGGIRCPFHGWLYDIEGHCLQQPAEQEGDSFKEKIRHPSYPCQELGGVIFAYLGPPDQMPLLPHYEALVREDGTRQAASYTINCNYLQTVEGSDATHFPYLHTEPWSELKGKLFSMPPTRLVHEETDYGLFETVSQPHPGRGGYSKRYGHFLMPAQFLRTEARSDRVLRQHSWFVPIDDTHTFRVRVGFAPLGVDGTPHVWREEEEFTQPGPENDYFRDYDRIDTISGISSHSSPGEATKGFLSQDNMVQESEGPIMDRSREHLGSSDQIVIAVRRLMQAGITDVEEGRDPKHILRDPSQNRLIQMITGDDEVAEGGSSGAWSTSRT